MLKEKIITVFGSSRPLEGEPDYDVARALGHVLAECGFAVCTGGYGGVMAGVSRGAKEAGGKTYGVTADIFSAKANAWIDVEVRVATWQDRLFELIRLADGFVACKGGTGTLVELAVVWEMLNKSVMPVKPFTTLGDFWQPVIERVREVELGRQAPSSEAPTSEAPTSEANNRLIHSATSPREVAQYLAGKLK
jgi:uncharacterized protein (TIGR00725 family)